MTHAQLSEPGNSRHQLGRMLAVDHRFVVRREILTFDL